MVSREDGFTYLPQSTVALSISVCIPGEMVFPSEGLVKFEALGQRHRERYRVHPRDQASVGGGAPQGGKAVAAKSHYPC